MQAREAWSPDGRAQRLCKVRYRCIRCNYQHVGKVSVERSSKGNIAVDDTMFDAHDWKRMIV